MLSLEKKKSQASREGTNSFPQPSSLKISQLPFHVISKRCSISPSMGLSLSWGDISAPRTATATLGSWKHQPVLQQLHLHSKRERSTSKISIQKLWRREAGKVGDLGGVLLGSFLNPRRKLWERISLFPSSPHNLPVLSSMSANKPDSS